jgi:ABC-type sugar transport systems, permease components
MAKSSLSKMKRIDQRTGYLFLAPAVITLLVVLIAPLFTSLYLSFTKWNYLDSGSKPEFVGLDNYTKILSNPYDLYSFKVTIMYVLVAVFFQLLLGLGIALLISREMRAKNTIRALILFPMMISDVVAALCFRYILHPDFGIVNYYLRIFGLNVEWGNPTTAFLIIVMAEVWQNTSFAALILLAGLLGLPSERLEAAQVDGAGYFQRFWHIILPAIKPQILVVIIFRIMFTIRVFAQPWVLTAGGPSDRTSVLGINIYRRAFRYYELGEANALAWLLIVLSMALILTFVLLLDQREDRVKERSNVS